MTGATVGAPPDEFFTRGQDWGFRPAHPDGRRADDYRELRLTLAHHLRHAGALRIDHVMGLHRMWVIPSGLDPAAGAYVRYPKEELAAVHCLEADRFGAAIVAENLGTVPPEVDELLDAHGWLGMFVAEFELDPQRPEVLAPPPARVVASIGTHDTASFGAFWSGSDIDDRSALGAIDPDDAADERAGRAEVRSALLRRTTGRGEQPRGAVDDERAAREVLGSLLEDLGRSDAELVLVTLEDLWLERRPQNVPGVGPDRFPSWRRRAARTLADLRDAADVAALLERLQAAREMTKELAC